MPVAAAAHDSRPPPLPNPPLPLLQKSLVLYPLARAVYFFVLLSLAAACVKALLAWRCAAAAAPPPALARSGAGAPLPLPLPPLPPPAPAHLLGLRVPAELWGAGSGARVALALGMCLLAHPARGCYSFSPHCALLVTALQAGVGALASGGSGGVWRGRAGGGGGAALLPPPRRAALALALLGCALGLWWLGSCLTPPAGSAGAGGAGGGAAGGASPALLLALRTSGAEEALGSQGSILRAWFVSAQGHSEREAFERARRALLDADFMRSFQPVLGLPWLRGAVWAARWAAHGAVGVVYASDALGASALGAVAWALTVWRAGSL